MSSDRMLRPSKQYYNVVHIHAGRSIAVPDFARGGFSFAVTRVPMVLFWADNA